jgi:hypothetical protein
MRSVATERYAARKLAGEHIPDGDWHWFIDYARRFKDPSYELLRGSPGAFGGPGSRWSLSHSLRSIAR